MKHRILTQNDSRDLAKLHQIAFKNFFLSSLGPRFLDKFYKAILQDKNGIGVGIFENERLVGFVIGTKEVQGFYKHIAITNSFSLFFSALPAFFVKPAFLVRLATSLKASNTSESGPFLLSICVDPLASGKGIGTALVKLFEQHIDNGIVYKLTTDKENNDAVNKFYLKNNFTFEKEIKQGKRNLNVYNKIKK